MSIRFCLNESVPIPAVLAIEFQSTKPIYPADKACEKLYIPEEACSVVAPAKAAALDTPLIAATASGSFTPAFVNLPMLLVISEKEYIVLSAYSFNSSRYLLTTSILSPVPDIIV